MVTLAICTALGAWWSAGLPLAIGLAAVLVALVFRRPPLLCLGALFLASALGARSWAGLVPQSVAPVAGEVTLLTDPEPLLGGGVRAEARLGRERVQLVARSSSGSVLRNGLAGERSYIRGTGQPLEGRTAPHLRRRHVSRSVMVAEAQAPVPGSSATRVANELRRTLVRGAQSLDVDRRALFTGLVLGDDRAQTNADVDAFRRSGLSHLLAVSGSNIAFVLAVAAPVLTRLGLRPRLVGGVAVVVGFGLLTRWEPSVTRASAMAIVAMVGATVGRPSSSVRGLCLAVTALLLIDPLLVGSVGFLLSTGACAGIALFSERLQRWLPSPLAVTVAAQVGVTPVLLPVFGGVPIASLPANLLAGPAAGPVMIWGLVAGVPAGLVGEPWATVLHLPTRMLVGWIAGVARWSAALPLGEVRARHALALAALAGTGWLFRVRRQRRMPAAQMPGRVTG
ncbi:MAG: DNA internalization-related competence protein ComEC/Rec2 [uncultured Acidimicrobiales bacterium]|uniref:DNA internalization-related competence protein ComEC/Rec2 n=1 Tax=uncultured Acidimicrobiales bacterium TaxID=310071 RepID=A0A6J4J2N3_9ACTN|nr:MAG: DNA internalization-related competence protein ComEC/Rec2 [uncultured Acidimicrobiales bacterium]